MDKERIYAKMDEIKGKCAGTLIGGKTKGNERF